MASKKVPGIANFYRGDTRNYRIRVTDKETGLPISIDGGHLFVTFKSDKSLSDAEAEISVSIPAVELDPENPTGIIEITLSATDTEVPPGYYYYDFQYVSSTGGVTTIIPQENMITRVKIIEDTTRRVI